MKRKLVIIGPSDASKPERYGSVTDYRKWLRDLANVLRRHFDTVYFIPDKGTYVDLALAFADERHKIIAVIPEETEEYIAWATRYTKDFQVIPGGEGWTFLNSHIIGLADEVLCLGYSAGSVLEICSAKYLAIYEKRIIRIMVDERAISTELPQELHDESINITYFSSEEYLDRLLSHD